MTPPKRHGWPSLTGVTPVLAAPMLGGVFFLAGRLSVALASHDGRLAPVWIANAVALTALLCSPRRRWWAYGAACLLANMATSLSAGNSPVAAACMTLGNGVEYLVGAVILSNRLPRSTRVDTGRTISVVAVVTLGVGLLAAALAAMTLSLLQGDDPAVVFRTWALAHPLSLLLLTPCFLVLTRSGEDVRIRPAVWRSTISLLVLGGCTLVVFSQTRAPVLFLIPPALLLVAVEVGAKGAAVGVLFTALVAIAATSHNLGPVALMHADVLERMAVLQLFLVVSLGSSLPVAGLQARQRRLQAETRAEAERAVRAEAAASESEARYRLMAQSVNDMLAITSPVDSSILFVSQASEGVLGYRPDELLGRTTLELTHPEDRPDVVSFFTQLIAAGPDTQARPYQFRGRHKDGSWRWLEGQPRVLFSEDGAPLRFQDVVRDITARKDLEAELRAARAEAEAAAQVKSQFLANMSHELRTPLTAVIGFANLIQEQPELSGQTRQYVARVQTAGRALLATVNDVLDFSKLEAGHVEISRTPTAPGELAREVVQLFDGQAQAKSVALRLELAADLPAGLELDANRVRQVLTNLVGNAVKFTDAGSVEVSLAYADGELRVAVRDTGVGVAPEQARLLFQRFSQVDGSNTRRHGGTGLGLAICKGLVEAMDGRIGLTSTPGEGSSFAFALPATRAEVEFAAPPPQEAARRRLLLAEDNAVNRELVKALLLSHPVEVETVEDGAQAVAAAGERSFDLILMDLHMPVLDGREAARAVRAGGGPNVSTPILAFSADALDPEVHPFDGAIAKPITPRAFFASLARHFPAHAPDDRRRA